MGEAFTRHSLRPLDLFEGVSIAEPGRIPPRECDLMSEYAWREIWTDSRGCRVGGERDGA